MLAHCLLLVLFHLYLKEENQGIYCWINLTSSVISIKYKNSKF